MKTTLVNNGGKIVPFKKVQISLLYSFYWGALLSSLSHRYWSSFAPWNFLDTCMALRCLLAWCAWRYDYWVPAAAAFCSHK